MKKGFLHWAKIFGSGLCIGAADIVPGISGGTVAFIIGIYEELLKSIATLNGKALGLLFRGRIKAFFEQVAWQFLLAILLGVACSFISLAQCFTYLLNHEIYRTYLYSGFMGLVLGSTLFCIKQVSSWNLKLILSLFLGAIIAFFLSGADFAPKKSEELFDVPVKEAQIYRDARLAQAVNYDPIQSQLLAVPKSTLSGMLAKQYLTKESVVFAHESTASTTVDKVLGSTRSQLIDPWIVVCGVIAISAMLLPGISGSYLLTILGMYGFILGALVDFIAGVKSGLFDVPAFRILLSMAIGIVFGAALFSRVVSYLLTSYRSATLASLIGFMIGALRSVWPFWTYSYALNPLRLSEGAQLQVVDPVLPHIGSMHFFVALFFLLLGFSTVLVVEKLARRLNKELEIIQDA